MKLNDPGGYKSEWPNFWQWIKCANNWIPGRGKGRSISASAGIPPRVALATECH